MPKAPLTAIAGTPDRPLIISGVEIPCYVLEDETRVLSQGGFLQGIGRSRTPPSGKRGVDKLPFFLSAANLNPYLGQVGKGVSTNPIQFRLAEGGPVSYGYQAQLLSGVCQVYLEARRAGALRASQMHIAERAELLIRGLATVGIVALVDEATGYQELRGKRALANILEKFIAKELQPWIRTFPNEYYEQIFRLNGWEPRDGEKRPQVIGHFTNDIVYDRLAPGVLRELQRLNPMQSGGTRRNRHHQWFIPERGYLRLREHLIALIALMRSSLTWESFKQKLQLAYPLQGSQLPLPDFD